MASAAVGYDARAYDTRSQRSGSMRNAAGSSRQGSAAPKRASDAERRRGEVRVVEGGRSRNQALKGLSPAAVRAFVLICVFALVFSLVCGVRVALSAATLDALTVNQELETELDEAIETGSELEIQRSILTSSSRIKKKARALGMRAATDVTYITVDLDLGYETNADGTISLSRSLAALGGAGNSSRL